MNLYLFFIIIFVKKLINQTWCFLDIRLNTAKAKIFQGEREDFIKYYHTNYCNKSTLRELPIPYCKCKESVNTNNEASVGEIEINGTFKINK